jgi:hypothetical protein
MRAYWLAEQEIRDDRDSLAVLPVVGDDAAKLVRCLPYPGRKPTT